MVRKTGKKASAKTTGKTGRKTVTRKRSVKISDLCIELPAEQGIRNVAELHQRLLAVAEHAAGVTIDVSSITRVDSAILQLLSVFVIERKRHGRSVAWKQPSEVFYHAARMIDLANALGLPPVSSRTE